MKFMAGFSRCISFILCVVFVISVITGATAFRDVNINTAQGKAIAAMKEQGYINGFEDGTFRPDATLTRAEFVTIINEMYRYYVESENIFTDVKEDDWFRHAVLTGVQAGYIKGMGDGRFAPNSPVTREQVCVMLDAILKIDSAPFKPNITDKVSDWAKNSVEKMVAIYLFSLEDGGKFRGTEPITRGEVCEALEKCVLDIDFEEVFQPLDLDKIAEEELKNKLEKIVKCMEEVIIPTYTFEETIQVGNMVVDSMKKYLKDNSFDYVTAASETYEVYRQFNSPRAREFKDPIYENLDVHELAVLFDFFYRPEMNLPK